MTTELSGFHLKHETLADMACFTPTLTAEVVIAKGRQGERKKIISFLIDNRLVSQSSWGFEGNMGWQCSSIGHVPQKVSDAMRQDTRSLFPLCPSQNSNSVYLRGRGNAYLICQEQLELKRALNK